MNTSFNINNLKGLDENNKREKLFEVLNNQKIERNNENKRKRQFPALWEKNEKKLLRNSVRNEIFLVTLF
jgi:hypothetical protein